MNLKTVQKKISEKETQKMLSLCKVKKIALFGSTTRKKQRSGGDLDFLVEFAKGADLFDQVCLKDSLEQIFSKKVDVVTLRSLSKYIKAQVMCEAIYL